MNPANPIVDSANALIAKYKDAVADGSVTFAEVVGIVSVFGQECVKFAAGQDLTGEQKKAAVMEAVETFIDDVITPIDLPIPDWIEGFVDSAVKQALMKFADGAVEGAVKLLRVDAI